MIDKERIAAIRARLEAATPGDWAVDVPRNYCEETDDICVLSDGVYVCQVSYDGSSITRMHNVMEDAEFIAHAKKDIAYLLDMLEVAS